MQSLIREPDGNVVLRSNDFALRFFSNYGGTPLEWWKDNYPLLTNPFPGSGAGINWEVGQDPTQASANGITKHPICTFSGLNPDRNYYVRETIFDPDNFIYQVTGFAPDFWLSREPADDFLRTPHWVSYGATDIAYVGNSKYPTGSLQPANEMEPDKCRLYLGGRVAARIFLKFEKTNSGARAGLVSKNFLFSIGPDGYVRINKKKIKLLRSEWAQLGQGVWLSIQTYTNLNVVHCFIGSRWVGFEQGQDLSNLGLWAQAKKGLIIFGHRQFFDLNRQFRATYRALPNGEIESDLAIIPPNDLGEPQIFYRANLPGIFLSATTFPERYCEPRGIVLLREGTKLWCGNREKTVGIQGTIVAAEVDGQSTLNGQAHALLDSHGCNDEFVMMLNPFAPNTKLEARNCRMVTRWQTYGSVTDVSATNPTMHHLVRV